MLETPDYSDLKTVDAVEAEIVRYKDIICQKSKIQSQTKQQKKDTNKSYNEALKELGEEIDFSLEVIDELKRRMKELEADL